MQFPPELTELTIRYHSIITKLMMRGLQHLPYEDRREELELMNLEKVLGRPYSGLLLPEAGPT